MSNAAASAAGPVVEKFAATGGRTLGYLSGVLLVVLAVGLLASDAQANVELVLGCVAAVLLDWLALIRPQAAAHANGLVLRNMLRDVFIPWTQVRRCKVGQTLQVATDDAQFHGLGVTRSARSMIKGERTVNKMQMRAGNIFGMGGAGAGGRGDSASAYAASRRANEEATGGSYTDYVSTRILALAQRGEVAGARTLVVWDKAAVAALAAAAVSAGLIFV